MRDRFEQKDVHTEYPAQAVSPEGAIKMDRRQFVAGILSVLMASACDHDPVNKSTVKEEELPTDLSVEVVVDESIQIPTSKLLDKKYTVPKPANIRIPDDKYRDILSEKIPGFLREQLIPKLQSTPRELNVMTQEVLNELLDYLMKLHPEFNRELSNFLKTWDHKRPSMGDHLNRCYFLPAGYYLSWMKSEGDQARVNFYPIESTVSVDAGDDLGNIEFPVFYLGKSLMPLESHSGAHGFTGMRDQISDITALFVWTNESRKDVFEVNVELHKEGKEYLSSHPLLDPANDSTDREKDNLRDVIHHESIHALLGARFPVLDYDTETNPVPAKFDFQVAGLPHPISGVYDPISFDELCAHGAELAQASSDSMFVHYDWFNRNRLIDKNYQLSSQLISMITLAVSPDTPDRDRLIAKLAKGTLSRTDLIALIGKPPFEIAHTKRVGEIMYRLGYDQIRKMQASSH